MRYQYFVLIVFSALFFSCGLAVNQMKVTTMIRTVLRKELDIPVIEIEDDGVMLEGADILFTGKTSLAVVSLQGQSSVFVAIIL